MDYSPERPAEVWVSEHPDGSVLLDSATGRVMVCNAVGARILSDLLEGLGIDAIADRIARTFRVEPEKAKLDALAFMAELQRLGLLARRIQKT